MDNKYFQALTDGLRKFFGKPEASEAELDEMLRNAGTVDEAKAQAAEAMKAELEEKAAEAANKIAELETRLSALAEAPKETAGQVDEIAATMAKISTRLDAVQARQDELAKEIATDRAKFDGRQKTTDEGVQTPKVTEGPTPVHGTVIESKQLAEEVYGKVKN